MDKKNRASRSSHLDDLKNHKDNFYWSIYGENISCLALFEMQTHLKPITVTEYIESLTSS